MVADPPQPLECWSSQQVSRWQYKQGGSFPGVDSPVNLDYVDPVAVATTAERFIRLNDSRLAPKDALVVRYTVVQGQSTSNVKLPPVKTTNLLDNLKLLNLTPSHKLGLLALGVCALVCAFMWCHRHKTIKQGSQVTALRAEELDSSSIP